MLEFIFHNNSLFFKKKINQIYINNTFEYLLSYSLEMKKIKNVMLHFKTNIIY